MENMVTELTAADYPAVLELWEASVRATHTFLKPEEIDFYKPFVLKYALPDCRLYGIKTNKGSLKAFIGLSEDKVEMLFVRPDCFRNGCGRRLMTFAEREKGIRTKCHIRILFDPRLFFFFLGHFPAVNPRETFRQILSIPDVIK